MITLKEISQKCNVSIATVSNILNGKSNVSEETKNRVLQVIKETGYKPNYMARSLRATSSKTIGMIVDDITAFGSPKIVEGIMEICEVHGYRAIMSNLRIFSKWLNKEHTHQDFLDLVNSALQEMLSLKVDGIVYVGAYSRIINFLPTEFPVPIVIAYSLSENNQIPAVYIEDVQSAYEMTSHMIQRGHRDIAVITGELSGIHSELRLKGYKKALEENGIPFREDRIGSGLWDFSGGYKACGELNLAQRVRNKEITALFCFNDLIAAGAYTYFTENDIKPGKDIAIGGFDNRDISECLAPTLTTMGIRVYSIGRKAAEVLINLIKGIETKETALQIPCLLFQRDSIPEKN